MCVDLGVNLMVAALVFCQSVEFETGGGCRLVWGGGGPLFLKQMHLQLALSDEREGKQPLA